MLSGWKVAACSSVAIVLVCGFGELVVAEKLEGGGAIT